MKNVGYSKIYEVPDVNLKKTGNYIKSLRVKNCLKVSQLQEYFGFEYPQAIYDWEAGKKLPCISNLIGLAALYGVTIDELLKR